MKPILFNTEMVRAILDGRKTVTRRVVKFPEGLTGSHAVGEAGNPDNPLGLMWAGGIKRPPYHPGDILYVRETFFEYNGRYYYKADGKHEALDTLIGGSFFKWHPSIHMPKEAARLFLRVTDVRVERLQYCGYAQALDEGCSCGSQFARLWDSTIKKADLPRYGWTANPWVWVIEFEKISKEEAIQNA